MAENQAKDPQTEKVITLSAGQLELFQGHPFRVVSGEEMEQLKESVRENGVLVRPVGIAATRSSADTDARPWASPNCRCWSGI